MAVSILLVRALVEAVEQAGIDRAKLFAGGRFDAARIENGEGRLTLAEYDALAEVALDLTADPALGLHMGETASTTTHNLAAHLVAHAPTMREGIDALARFHRLMTDRPAFHLAEGEDTATLSYELARGSLRCRRFRAEIGLVGFARMVRFFVPGGLPDRVWFAHPVPAYRSEYDRIFDGLAEFDRAATSIEFDRAFLSAPHLHQDADFHAALQVHAARRISRLQRNATHADRVREHLLAHGSADKRDMEAVARALGLSVRSLRRRLHEEGVSYGDLVDETRATLAKRLLVEDDRSIEETAYEMGFSDPSAFHRAFKRWTGTTPREFRLARQA